MSYKAQHFISYGDDRPNSCFRIKKQAESFNTFKTIDVYNNKDIYDEEFKEKYKFVLNQKKGGGYWIWKYYLINKKINEINEGEYIIYCDAGCQLNIKGLKRYYEYLDLLKNSDYGFISFPLQWNKKAEPPPNEGCNEKIWCVKQLLKYLNIDKNCEIANSPQFAGGILILKKCENTLKILKEYGKVLETDQKLITDYYNDKGQEYYFRDNRHDQSIWGLLRKIYGSIVLEKDESFFYFQNFVDKQTFYNYYGNEERWKYPFWATRDRVGRKVGM